MDTRPHLGTRLSFTGAWYTSKIAHAGSKEVLMFRALANRGNLGCNYIDLVALEPNTSIGLHRHGRNDTEIYVKIQGMGEMTIEDETLVVTTGDVVVNPPNGTHGLVNVGKTLLKLVVIDVPVAHDTTSKFKLACADNLCELAEHDQFGFLK